MILTLLMFLAAIGIASISAYFSIFGLVALFSASPIAIIIAGAVTEFGKLTLVSYFYQFKEFITLPFKFLLSFIIVTVMAVTSIGVFGFLSSSYLEHRTNQGTVENKMERLDSKIERQNKKLDRNQSIIDDFDKAYEKYLDVNYISKALKKREEQKEQREKINERIREIESRLSELRDQKAELKAQKQSVESQVGPIKYFAIALYGEDEDSIDKAVRLLIILLIIILDPFAVTILICANHALAHRHGELAEGFKNRLWDRINNRDSKVKKEDDIEDNDNNEPITEADKFEEFYDLSKITNNERFVRDMEREFDSDENNEDDKIDEHDSIKEQSDEKDQRKRQIGGYSFVKEDFNEDENKPKNNSSGDHWLD